LNREIVLRWIAAVVVYNVFDVNHLKLTNFGKLVFRSQNVNLPKILLFLRDHLYYILMSDFIT